MTGKNLPSLSPAETEIVRLIWQLGAATVQDVRDKLPPERDIAYATVQTLLRRLLAKGYVTRDASGRAHVFRPAVDRDRVIKRTVGDFVQRLFGGDPAPLLLHLADRAELTPQQAERLRRLLDADGREDKGKSDERTE